MFDLDVMSLNRGDWKLQSVCLHSKWSVWWLFISAMKPLSNQVLSRSFTRFFLSLSRDINNKPLSLFLTIINHKKCRAPRPNIDTSGAQYFLILSVKWYASWSYHRVCVWPVRLETSWTRFSPWFLQTAKCRFSFTVPQKVLGPLGKLLRWKKDVCFYNDAYSAVFLLYR